MFHVTVTVHATLQPDFWPDSFLAAFLSQQQPFVVDYLLNSVDFTATRTAL